MSEREDYMLDLYIKEDRVERVKHYTEHVQKLFDVELQFAPPEGKQFMPVAGQWLDVEGQRRNVIKARVGCFIYQMFCFHLVIFIMILKTRTLQCSCVFCLHW